MIVAAYFTLIVDSSIGFVEFDVVLEHLKLFILVGELHEDLNEVLVIEAGYFGELNSPG